MIRSAWPRRLSYAEWGVKTRDWLSLTFYFVLYRKSDGGNQRVYNHNSKRRYIPRVGDRKKARDFPPYQKVGFGPPSPGPFKVKGVSLGRKSNKSNPTVYIDSESRIQTLDQASLTH